MSFNRDSKWKTHHGEWIRVRDMEDTHVANLIQYMMLRLHDQGYSLREMVMDSRLKTFMDEAKLRGLDQKFLLKAPYPYKAPKGQLRVWDNTVGWSVPFKPATKLTYQIQRAQLFAGLL